MERSLQIREFNPTTGDRIRRPVPDITAFDRMPDLKSANVAASNFATPTIVLPASETLLEPYNDEDYLRALVIHDKGQEMPVTRIELLSPTNKPPGEGSLHYGIKRDIALWSGVALVEMDYLQETRSPIRGIPHYPHEAGSYPYNIAVTDPRPTLPQGETRVYSFRVDDPILVVPIPLADDETLIFDFGTVYRRTFSTNPSFYEAVDYEQMPVAMESYDSVDRERIEERCQTVAKRYPAS